MAKRSITSSLPARKDRIVLVSTAAYSPAHHALLEQLVARNIELFCAAGVDCASWEDAMDAVRDSYAHERARDDVLMTTQHEGEPVEEVVAYAKNYPGNEHSTIEVIEV